MNNTLSVEKLRSEVEKIREHYQEVIKTYRAYKRLREKIGKPEGYPLDPQKIMEDLSSEEFFKFLKELRGEKIEE